MDLVAVLPAFLGAVVLICASPGPAMALILRRAALHGWRATVPTVLGLELGVYLWALAAGAGLAALVAASEVAYTVLRVVGAAVLLVLGIKAWRSAWTDHGTPEPPVVRGRSARGAFVEGLLVMLANPKAAMFVFAFYPVFVPSTGPVLAWTAALAALQVVVETALYLGLAAAVGRAAGWFRRPKVRRTLEAVGGTVLVGLGVKVATTP